MKVAFIILGNYKGHNCSDHEVLVKRKLILDQLYGGLSDLNFIELIKTFSKAMQPLLVKNTISEGPSEEDIIGLLKSGKKGALTYSKNTFLL